MKHVILPPLEEYGPAELREGRASSALIRNRALRDAGNAIRRAGGSYSHEVSIHTLYLEDAFRVDSFGCQRIGNAERVEATAARRERLQRAASAACLTTQ